MQSRIDGENEAPFVLPNVQKESQHLFAADLAGLVHEDDRTASRGAAREEGADRLSANKTVTFQIGDLLTLRSEHFHIAAVSLERPLHFPECAALSRACTATEQRDEIPRGQNMSDSLKLLSIQ